MKSLFAKCIKEIFNQDIIEDDYSYITYKIENDECHIGQIFCDEEHRGKGKSYKQAILVEAIAKEAGCKFLTSNVQMDLHGSHHSIELQLRYGFKIIGGSNFTIFLKKEI